MIADVSTITWASRARHRPRNPDQQVARLPNRDHAASRVGERRLEPGRILTQVRAEVQVGTRENVSSDH
jgi:hypothetical protein